MKSRSEEHLQRIRENPEVQRLRAEHDALIEENRILEATHFAHQRLIPAEQQAWAEAKRLRIADGCAVRR